MTPTPGGAVLLYDGVCGLCAASVQFILKRDPQGAIRFAPLQSELGRRLQADHGLPPGQLDTLVFIEDGRAWVRSGAALRIARKLAFPWWLGAALLAVPSFLLDPLYDFVAANRYAWFGKKDECELPRPEWRARFLA